MAGLDHALRPGGNARSLRDTWFARPVFGLPKSAPHVAALTICLMGALFIVDLLATLPVSIGVLYGFAIFSSAVHGRRPWVIGTAVCSSLLTGAAYVLGHYSPQGGDALFRCVYGIALQAVILMVVLRSMMVSRMLVDQAKLLDQTHDSVVLRRLDATLLYWNQGAVSLFGWSFEEARLHSQADLIGSGATLPPMTIEEFVEHGPWHGEIVVFARDGRRMVIDCRCSLLPDERGRPFAILTTGNDVTSKYEAAAELSQSEIRYRNIFQTTGIGIWECNFVVVREMMDALVAHGVSDIRGYLREHPEAIRAAINVTTCIDVNESTIKLFGAATKTDLLGPVGWVWPPESEGAFAESILAAREGRDRIEVEVKLNTLDGRKLDFLLSTAFPPESASRESVFVTVNDISARTAANAALRDAQADLAHASRLTSLGELAASIAHEVNQPVAGVLANGQAALRWLHREEPDLEAVDTSITSLIDEAKRARAIIVSIRALARNELPKPIRLDVAAQIH